MFTCCDSVDFTILPLTHTYASTLHTRTEQDFVFVPPLLVPVASFASDCWRSCCYCWRWWWCLFLLLKITTRHRISCVHVCIGQSKLVFHTSALCSCSFFFFGSPLTVLGAFLFWFFFSLQKRWYLTFDGQLFPLFNDQVCVRLLYLAPYNIFRRGIPIFFQ